MPTKVKITFGPSWPFWNSFDAIWRKYKWTRDNRTFVSSRFPKNHQIRFLRYDVRKELKSLQFTWCLSCIYREIYFILLLSLQMNISLFVLFSVVTVLLIHNSDAWRRRRRWRFRIGLPTKGVRSPPPPPCVGSDICAGSCLNGKCTWHCANTCDVMVNGEVM